MDSLEQNILGVRSLVSDNENKAGVGVDGDIVGAPLDEFELDMSDEELIALDKQWVQDYAPYEAKIKLRQDRNKIFYCGLQNDQSLPTSSNLLFESEETFIPQALAKNPEPVVWSDNTEEGKSESNKIKTMLQYHADTLVLSRILGVMIRHWSIYFIGIAKHGWDKKKNDITLDIRNPKNFIFDPNGYVDVKGSFKGKYLGEKIESTASELIEMFDKHEDYIKLKVKGKLGTTVTRTEWWTDEYCFTVFGDVILDKHKNEFFNYDKKEKGIDEDDEEIETMIAGRNHLPAPQMPYTFLSVFSLEETPHDITNLIEQNIANQVRISDRDKQIDRNLYTSNNSLILSGTSFNQETAHQAAAAVEDGHPILAPDGNTSAVVRLPANPLPSGILDSQQIAKEALRSVFGVQGLSAQKQSSDTTARGMILNQGHDTTRIGGGIGDALEQVADNIFNFQVQMYYRFYDEAHYAAIMGQGQAVEYTALLMKNVKRQFVVSVSPNSMQPKDEVSEMNLAVDLYKSQALDPINLFKKLNYPDPMATAKMMALWVTNPQMYMQLYFPEIVGQDSANPQNPPDQIDQIQPDQTGSTLAASPVNAGLDQVPINAGVAMP